MTRDELQQRTKAFALRIMNMADHLPKGPKGVVLANQLLRSATSVAANYRAACRARSSAEFAHKMGVALEEADESKLWLELIVEGGLLPEKRLVELLQEAGELTAILFSAVRTAKNKTKS